MSTTTPATSNAVLFLSHGGGPLPLLGDEAHQDMVDNLRQLAGRIGRPKAIIVISAHWEARRPTITQAANPALIYDYYGFPAAAYDIQYPAPGHPALAEQLFTTLNQQGFAAALDAERGFDHGLFVPLAIMYPDADIPCLQLSLLDSLNPDDHIRMGEALAALPQDNLLIIGSGFSFHNMQAFYAPESDDSRTMNIAFEQWLIDTCTDTDLDEASRTARLQQWEQAPAARYCHPREEHLLPLHVCYGATRRACNSAFELTILGKKASAYLW